MKKELKNIDFIDIHSHLHDKVFDIDRKNVLEKMLINKIATISIGTDLEQSLKAKILAKENENVFYSVGLHPHDNLLEFTEAFLNQEEYFEKLENLIDENCLAIGECGLDYFYFDNLNQEEILKIKIKQKILFEKQIDLAIKKNLPLMLHIRPSKNNKEDAYLDAVKILLEKRNNLKIEEQEKLRGNFHFFTSTQKVLEEIFKLKDWTISLPAVCTITDEFDELIKNLSEEKFHIETDSPYVMPKNRRKETKRNQPNFVLDVFEKISDLKNFKTKIEKENFQIKLKENFKKMFLNK